MALYLNVPFAEKDEAKAFGARWDAEKKKWYVKDSPNYHKFQKWILAPDEDECMVVCDHFYLIEGLHTCFKCRKQTKVVGFGIENFISFYNNEAYDDSEPEYCQGEIHIAESFEPLSDNLLDYLKRTYNYYYGYSKFTNSNYYGNHCNHCGVLQGNFYLFSEVDSPFCVDSIEAAKALKLYRIALPSDIKAFVDVGFGSEDHLIKEYAEIVAFEVSV